MPVFNNPRQAIIIEGGSRVPVGLLAGVAAVVAAGLFLLAHLVFIAVSAAGIGLVTLGSVLFLKRFTIVEMPLAAQQRQPTLRVRAVMVPRKVAAPDARAALDNARSSRIVTPGIVISAGGNCGPGCEPPAVPRTRPRIPLPCDHRGHQRRGDHTMRFYGPRIYQRGPKIGGIRTILWSASVTAGKPKRGRKAATPAARDTIRRIRDDQR